ncbi:uncharacterized protein [Paramisgurnus dabryanus]|uniref:uncharacterized protein isoform X2 n=1 Tax=Paramisgurnus dabryanus TaxID=90735 RepID=UPI003CCF92C9
MSEQLFSDMRKNNDFLNTLTPSGHIFLMRNILQHYNTKQNKKIEDGIRKIVPQNSQLHLNVHGQIIMVATASAGTPAATASAGTPAATASAGTPAATASAGTPAATASAGTPGSVVRLMHAEREIKDFRRWEGTTTLHDCVLDCTKPQDEVVCSIGTTVLRRADCVGLVTNCELEATVVNCCLSLICYLARQKGLDVLAVDSYVLACWSPPHCLDPFESLPADAALKDCILFPVWTPGHWHLCHDRNKIGSWKLATR